MTEHLSFDQLSDYLVGVLEESASEDIEAHLFACPTCAAESERLFAIAAVLRSAVPPVLSRERFEEFSREGRVAAVNVMSPGGSAEVRYPPEGKLLIHQLGGAHLSDVSRVDVLFTDLEGKTLARFEDVPFDAEGGEVFIACQSHFATTFPRDGIFHVETIAGEHREEASRYTVFHRL